MKEFALEDGQDVNIELLKAPFLPVAEYQKSHQSTVIACHDIIISYQGGLLLVQREKHPAKGTLWPLGGRISRGMSTEESLRKKVREESGLELDEIQELGITRTYFSTNPLGHGKGTDTLNVMFYGRGGGILKLDSWHSKPVIVTPAMDTIHFKASLHPYVQEMVELGMKILKEKKG